VGLIEAIILGIVQGLTEFLPISSTAHLRIVPSLLGWADPGAAFTAVIQLGTLAAVLIYFWKDLVTILSAWVKSLQGRPSFEGRLGWGIVWGTIPIVLLGLAGKKYIEGSLRSLTVIASMLIIVGLLMLIAEKVSSHKRTFDSLSPRDGLFVGLWQCLALIPGASRSGSTITGGLFLGLDRAAAARFSFLLSVPSVFAAGIYEAVKERKAILGADLAPTVVATFVSFVVGYAAIAFLMAFLQKRSTMVFVIYRVALGVLILVLIATHHLEPLAGAVKSAKG
jgi:undecaprenyl-diphosphatase